MSRRLRKPGHDWAGHPGVTIARVPLSLIRNFWRHVTIATDGAGAPDFSQCWIWTGTYSGSKGRYGHFRVSPTQHVKAHRFALALFSGQLPHNRDAAHRCNNTLCVNPAHLHWATREENLEEMNERRWAGAKDRDEDESARLRA